MELLPILSTLRRHKTAACLIVVEVAITSAIVCNALHLISDRIKVLDFDSGLPEAELIAVDVRGTGAPGNVDEVVTQDLQALRALPGVKNAAITNQVIYGNSSNNSDVYIDPAFKERRFQVAHYNAGEQALPTMACGCSKGATSGPRK